MSEMALELRGVTRTFGRTVALDRLDLSLEPGQVLGLVGSNGAGKTTLLRLAHGMLYPDDGTIRVLGLDPIRDEIEVKTRASVLSEESSLYPWMTVREILDFGGALHPRWDAKRADSLVERLGLDPSRKIRELSRGTRAKVALLLAVACRPDLLLLDDPTAGLDPLVRREVLQGMIEAMPAEGGAVVYASHLVHDVERVSDRVAVLDEGRLTLEGSLDEIKGRVRRAVAVFEDEAPATADFEDAIDHRTDGRVLSVVSDSPNGEIERRLRGLGASRVTVEPMSLEEILVACLRRSGSSEVRHA